MISSNYDKKPFIEVPNGMECCKVACINDLASVKKDVVQELNKAYDEWWEAVFFIDD